MSAINLNKFAGMYPRVSATSLPSNAALTAGNVDFAYGHLQSLRGAYKLRDLAVAARSVFSQDGLRFYAWAEDVDCLMSPMRAGDSHDRLYYTTESDFRVTLMSAATTAGRPPAFSYRVGVPRPTVAPAISVVHPPSIPAEVAEVNKSPADTYEERLKAAQADLDASIKANTTLSTETRAYTYTYANIYNEEGPPSPAATVLVQTQTYKGKSVTSTVTLQVQFDAAPDYVPISAARLYRTAATGATTDYYFVKEIPGNAGLVGLIDGVPGTNLNEVLASEDSYAPDSQLTGLIGIGNGIMAAFKGRELWFSDAYRPWSWPPSYMKTTKYPIVGIMPYGNGVLVTTLAEPTVFTGVSPDAMSETSFETPQAGVSKWAMLSIEGIAFYASNDGIVAINGSRATLQLSQKFFTRQKWRDLYAAGLSTMQFVHYDGRIVVFSKTGAFTAFMIELDEGGGEMTELPSFAAQTALTLVTSDQMYTVNGSALNQFGGGPDLPLVWQSGDIVLPAETILAIAEVECKGEFDIKIYQRGKLCFTQHVGTGKTQFRIPDRKKDEHAGCPPSDRWQFDIRGTGAFKWLKAAATPMELRRV